MSEQVVSERDMAPQRGAAFFRDEDGAALFRFVIDTGNIIGPRPATKADAEKHPEAFAVFVAAEPEPVPEPTSPVVSVEAVAPASPRRGGRPRKAR